MTEGVFGITTGEIIVSPVEEETLEERAARLFDQFKDDIHN